MSNTERMFAMEDRNKKEVIKKLVSGYNFCSFFLMICFHIGLALGAYSGIDFNADDISTKDWFMFAGSYLGGVMTLIGVTKCGR